MKARLVLKLEANDYKEAKRALSAAQRELEEQGHEAKDINISYRKEDTTNDKKS